MTPSTDPGPLWIKLHAERSLVGSDDVACESLVRAVLREACLTPQSLLDIELYGEELLLPPVNHVQTHRLTSIRISTTPSIDDPVGTTTQTTTFAPDPPVFTDNALVVSGYAEAGHINQRGGIFSLTSDGVQEIDNYPTTGLFFDKVTGSWMRATSRRELGLAWGEVFEYLGSPGRTRIRRIGSVLDAHDVLSVGDRRLVVDTHNNAIFAVRHSRMKAVYALPGEPDSWHLNCLEHTGGEVFASAFRRGGRYRDWAEDRWGRGCVFSLTTGAVVADGLSMPHSPRYCDGLWVVCDSANKALVGVDPRRPLERIFTVDLKGYTRGLAVDDDHFYVGVNPERHSETDRDPLAEVAVVSRSSLKLVDRTSIPCPEIYDVRIVPRSATEMLTQSIPTARSKLVLQRMTPEPTETTRAATGVPAGLSVRFVPPRTVRCGDVIHVRTRIGHSGAEPIARSVQKQLLLSYRWIGQGSATPLSVTEEDPIRTLLPPGLLPGTHLDLDVLVRAPALPGRYRLKVVLVQEMVRWIDDNEAGAFSDAVVKVR